MTLLVVALAMPLPTAAGTTPLAVADADKETWRFQRLSHDDDSPCWVFTEKVRLKPHGGDTHVFLQIKRPKAKKWQTEVRQTTLAKGRFDLSVAYPFGKAEKKAAKKYDTKYFEVDLTGKGSTYYQRILVRGDDTHRRYAGWNCTLTYGG